MTTLTYWNQTADPETIDAVDSILDDFMAENPDIKVEQTRYESDKLSPLVKNAFRSGDTPDLAYVEVSTGRELYEAGLAQSLEDYATEYGWKDRVAEGALAWGTADDGDLFGLGVEAEINGMLWDQTALDELGLTVPTTVDDLANVCQVARANDIVPISSGDNGAGWIWYFYLGLPILNLLGPEDEIAFANHEAGAWTDPDIRAAIETVLVTAKDAGCFIPEMSTLDNNTAISLIESKDALSYFPACTCNLEPIQSASPDNEYYMTTWPEVPGGQGQFAMQGMGSLWVINANSEHQDAVARFLDFMVSKDTGVKLVERAGFAAPVLGIDLQSADVSDLFKQGVEPLTDPDAETGMSIDLKSSGEFNDLMGRLSQEVFSDQITLDEFFDQLQAAWENEG
ncbi:extracellular solute-binding protein [Actinotalea sp. M2MS4P-6]|uniref:ABC transporter substrate-binding protein n=1 Tax=Actinotalea sp. M2MS4P-6 TaxID=2983762 RepID=UPI0021E43072|nr:extracellular solute-binding protein [Actinotalea sp. M2MS4P-6]MCV2395129.1 extracellular solute-binding protein [Actinotalea sp. M2MS4P-6]